MNISEETLVGTITELIDTLWNVNDAGYVSNVLKIRINRYIMECKLSISIHFLFPFAELIDTLWNVNTEEFSEDVQTETGINRYIMECK